MKVEQKECSETSAYKIHTPGNYPEESIQHRGNMLNIAHKVTLVPPCISPIFHFKISSKSTG